MGLCKTYKQLVGVRFCLGVTEAGLFPGKSLPSLSFRFCISGEGTDRSEQEWSIISLSGILGICFSIGSVFSLELQPSREHHSFFSHTLCKDTSLILRGAFSGLLAFGISFMSGRGGLLGWSWIFVYSSLIFPLCKAKSKDVDHRRTYDRRRRDLGGSQSVTAYGICLYDAQVLQFSWTSL